MLFFSSFQPAASNQTKENFGNWKMFPNFLSHLTPTHGDPEETRAFKLMRWQLVRASVFNRSQKEDRDKNIILINYLQRWRWSQPTRYFVNIRVREWMRIFCSDGSRSRRKINRVARDVRGCDNERAALLPGVERPGAGEAWRGVFWRPGQDEWRQCPQTPVTINPLEFPDLPLTVS